MSSKTADEIDEAREREDMKKLEAVFFVSGRFLTMQDLISHTDLNPVIIRELIEKLQEKYEKTDSAIEIISTPNQVGLKESVPSSTEKKDTLKGTSKKTKESLSEEGKNEMWKMDVRREYSNIINKFATGSSEFSKAEQETLAIIAYKQPIKQSVIIKIRGNKAYEHVKKFVDLGLLKKKKMGHTHELSLSDEFHDYFSTSEHNNPLKE